MDEDTRREIACLREYFDTVIKANDERYQQAADTVQESLSMARDGNNRRFDQMAEFRNAISDQVNRMISRQEFDLMRDSNNEKAEEARRTVDARFDSELKPINARLEQIGRPNWALMASIMSIFLVLVGGVWLIIGLKIDATVSPVSIDLAQVRASNSIDSDRLRQLELLTSNSSSADAQSRQDRSQLNERMRAAEATIGSNSSDVRGRIATLNAKLVEIETQFAAADQIRNLTHAQDMRVQAMLWAKTHPGEQLPTDNSYYPSISTRPPESVP
jgi:transcriptional regulator of met regulon